MQANDMKKFGFILTQQALLPIYNTRHVIDTAKPAKQPIHHNNKHKIRKIRF